MLDVIYLLEQNALIWPKHPQQQHIIHQDVMTNDTCLKYSANTFHKCHKVLFVVILFHFSYVQFIVVFHCNEIANTFSQLPFTSLRPNPVSSDVLFSDSSLDVASSSCSSAVSSYNSTHCSALVLVLTHPDGLKMLND